MLPGFQLLLGLGALFTADVRQRAEQANRPDQATPESMALFEKYLDIRAKAIEKLPGKDGHFLYREICCMNRTML